MNNSNQQQRTLPTWGVIVIVVNVLVALYSLVGCLGAVLHLPLEYYFHSPPGHIMPLGFPQLVNRLVIGAVLALLSAFGLTKAYKGKSGWTLAAIIMLGCFIILSLIGFSGSDSAPTLIYFDFPVRLLCWVGLIALYVKQKKTKTTA